MSSSAAKTVALEAVVVGGSAGALTGVKAILGTLSVPLRVPILVVLHLRDDRKSLLAEVLGRGLSIPVMEAEDKQPLASGHVYLAPPGYHLLVEDRHSLALSVDPPEHYSRPSIDALFESAAVAFGANLLGVLLSGASADGARGLLAIQRAGGTTIVQTPASAAHPAMPEAALSVCTPSLVLAPPELENTIASIAKRASLPYGGPDV